MIQINLLPDVKQQFIKTRRTKRLIIMVCGLAASATLVVMGVLLLVTDVRQSGSIADLDEEINTNLTKLQQTEDLDKILTVQKQLGALDNLHSEKTDATRLFTYLPQVIPSGITLDDLTIDYEASVIEISGAADSLSTVNVFVDTLKFAEYTIPDEVAGDLTQRAFAEVVLAGNSQEDGLAKFTITASFATDLFTSRINNLELKVPNTVTTRSQTEQPGALFEDSGGDDE